MLRRAVFPLTATLALMLLACGGSDDDGEALDLLLEAAGTPADGEALDILPPCSLVTLEQAEEVLGYDVDEPRLNDEGLTCIYEETDPNGFGGTVIVTQPDGFDLFDSFGGEYDEVPDLGDEARYYPDVLALVVQKGDRFISVELRTSSNAPDDLVVATGFAEYALQVLP